MRSHEDKEQGQDEAPSSAAGYESLYTEHDFYSVLRVETNAKQEDIKKAYRNEMKEKHTDKGGKCDQTQLIVAAYEVLFNPQTRREYDEVRKKLELKEPPVEH